MIAVMLGYIKNLQLEDIDNMIATATEMGNNEAVAVLINHKSSIFSSEKIEKIEEKRIEKAMGIRKLTDAETRKLWKCEKNMRDEIILAKYKGTDTIPIIPGSIGGKRVFGIDRNAFIDNKNIEGVIINDSIIYIDSWMLIKCHALRYNEFDNALYLGNEDNPYVVLVKPKNQNIESCDIANGTKIIAAHAFVGCTSLKNVSLPKTLTSIGMSAFENCSSLERIIIPKSVTHVALDAFSRCAALEILCEAKKQPKEWLSGWNFDKRPVVWGYKK